MKKLLVSLFIIVSVVSVTTPSFELTPEETAQYASKLAQLGKSFLEYEKEQL